MFLRRVATAMKVIAVVSAFMAVLYLILGLLAWVFSEFIIPLGQPFSTGWLLLEVAAIIFSSAEAIEHPRRIKKLFQFATYQMTDEQEETELLLEKLDLVMRAIEDDMVSPARLKEMKQLVAAIQGELKR